MQPMQLDIRDLRQAQSSRGLSAHVGDITPPAPMQRALPCHTPDVSCRQAHLGHTHMKLRVVIMTWECPTPLQHGPSSVVKSKDSQLGSPRHPGVGTNAGSHMGDQRAGHAPLIKNIADLPVLTLSRKTRHPSRQQNFKRNQTILETWLSRLGIA
eukprot:2743081-Amphidinium_carterae.2